MSPSKAYISAGALLVATAVMAASTYAFSPTLPSFVRQRHPLSVAAKSGEDDVEGDTEQDRRSTSPEKMPGYPQDDQTRAREAESVPGENDFCPETVYFDKPIVVKNFYGDDVTGMVRQIPAAFDEFKQLESSFFGQRYINMRHAVYVLASTKLEGILSEGASEGETFNFLRQLVEPLGDDSVHLIPPEDDKKNASWEEDGRNNSREAWFAQCRCHLRALIMMMNWAKADEPLTTEKLLACHNELMKGALTKDGARFQSRFRHFNEPVHADLYSFPDSIDHEEEMGKILAKMNSVFGTVHPVQWSCDLLHEVLKAHPFLNGNGRIARLCYAYGLARHGVECPIVFSDWHSKARGHYIGAVKAADGQRGQAKKDGLYTMGTVALYNGLQDMIRYCKMSRKD